MKPLNKVLRIDKKELPVIGLFGAAPASFARLEGFNSCVKEVDGFVMDEQALKELLEREIGRMGARVVAHIAIKEADKWIVRRT